ncbi:MAG: bifunctional 3-demethylubiquinone-9 3-methyltransferase/ 2-octaprenyl-6-hydroxy phenol methylase [Bacteroidetes bacterium ADurb.Bin217]|nr:MAG: bifunctional 3-demethylubiquinone-9 3-methyltransferase/ 2-octaprenyl-6-hydroxy phenol methylase [Bacteroidetes bacterium ADurb.Bin217]
MLRALISYIAKKVKQSSFVLNYLEAPINELQFPSSGVFTDSKGDSFEIRKGLRSLIKPGWEAMFEPKPAIPSNQYIATCKKNGKLLAQKLLLTAARYGKPIQTSHILEIGCNTGAASYWLAELGAKKVTGTEFSGYKVESVTSETTTQALQEITNDLLFMRTELAKSFINHYAVSFVDDDICNSQLPQQSFDIICSWDVLEHLHNTKQAFASMAQLLKSGGLLIHDYNPFFSINGGHSLCTLDFVWGHARLREKDFETYISMYRPNEQEQALSFYYKGLNRMSIADLQEQVIEAGFTIVACIPFTRPQHINTLNQTIIHQVQRIYPRVTALDLVSPRVLLVARKN